MKNSELITFVVLVERTWAQLVNNKDLYVPKVNIVFNEKKIIEQEIIKNVTKIEFLQECVFGKQRLIITVDSNIKIKQLKFNGIVFERFPNAEIICKQPTPNTYIFEFESPYSYYFINRWIA